MAAAPIHQLRQDHIKTWQGRSDNRSQLDLRVAPVYRGHGMAFVKAIDRTRQQLESVYGNNDDAQSGRDAVKRGADVGDPGPACADGPPFVLLPTAIAAALPRDLHRLLPVRHGELLQVQLQHHFLAVGDPRPVAIGLIPAHRGDPGGRCAAGNGYGPFHPHPRVKNIDVEALAHLISEFGLHGGRAGADAVQRHPPRLTVNRHNRRVEALVM